MLLTAFLLAATAPALDCSLMRAVAADAGAARRIAEAVIRNVPASPRARAAMAAGTPYDLIVEPDRDDAGLWIAFQSQRLPPPTGSTRGGGGLEFRIDRCTGAISRMHHSR